MGTHPSCIQYGQVTTEKETHTHTHESRPGQVDVPMSSAQELHGAAEVNPEIESGTCVPLPRFL